MFLRLISELASRCLCLVVSKSHIASALNAMVAFFDSRLWCPQSSTSLQQTIDMVPTNTIGREQGLGTSLGWGDGVNGGMWFQGRARHLSKKLSSPSARVSSNLVGPIGKAGH